MPITICKQCNREFEEWSPECILAVLHHLEGDGNHTEFMLKDTHHHFTIKKIGDWE